ncbi:unnamed protein product [Staurois parvus]|uniref:Sleeping Beauty transposase HTH domain-containing protein n=1 Tax=Staurois parvus TaxID=386267 RepID=A0ABN9DB09_9NEOB|nr:unnamed protein product [Staurois parvus]
MYTILPKISTILPNILGQPSKSCDSGVPIPSMATGMQTATNIGERMGRSQELSDSKRGPVIGGHLCNKSIRDISWLLNIPRSTVSGIITKWKQLGTTATQPPSGRPRHMTGRGPCMLKRTVRRRRQLSAESIAKDLQTWCGLQISQQQCVEIFMEWVSMAEQLHPSLTITSAMQSIGCRGVKHTATGL